MANKMLKPPSLLLYLLAPVACFLLGVIITGLVGAAKDQGLAAGAIVMGYGMMGAVIGLAVALFITSLVSPKLLVRINLGLTLIIALCYAYLRSQYLERQKAREQESSISLPIAPESTPKSVYFQSLLKIEHESALYQC